MKHLISIISLSTLLAGCIACTSCRKEAGYTGFVTPGEENGAELEVITDKASYKPGETVSFKLSKTPSGELDVRYLHLGETVYEHSQNTQEWTWTAPAEDYQGYMVEISLSDGTILATVAVDVSSDWSRFPRYGFLSSYAKMSETAIDGIISKLNRLHINGVQFQDWHWKHHFPLGGTVAAPMEEYLDIASRPTALGTVKGYVDACHKYGMKAIFYNLCFGALDDAAQDGVKDEWYLFSDKGHQNKDFHGLGAPFKSSIYLVNPGNAEWQKYIAEKNDIVYKVCGFDGYQIDQLGYRGTRYDYSGNEINLTEAYASFIRAMKEAHPDKDLIMNAVGSYGYSEIVGTGKVAFAYNELWDSESEFKDLRTVIENNYAVSDETRTVFAAYMNYDKANGVGVFNTPGVLLTDAMMFALGGSHLEMGEHMLGKEYFPNNNLGMTDELQNAIVEYYDFMTAYENLLRDGGSFSDVEISSKDDKLSFNSSEPQTGSVLALKKTVGTREVIHLLNLSQANSTSWRDLDGTMPEPAFVGSPSVEIKTSGNPKRAWFASPDVDGGACKELNIMKGNDGVTLSLPSLKYWDMIVLEY